MKFHFYIYLCNTHPDFIKHHGGTLSPSLIQPFLNALLSRELDNAIFI